jgi:hypothetical protein
MTGLLGDGLVDEDLWHLSIIWKPPADKEKMHPTILKN